MPDKSRTYSSVVVYAPGGAAHSWCTAETDGQAESIRKVYGRYYRPAEGFVIRSFPMDDHREAMAFHPPRLPPGQEGPTACIGALPGEAEPGPDKCVGSED